MKDEPDLLVADVGQLVAVELRNVNAVEKIFSARGPVEAAERVHHRGFARTARAHQRDEFALENFQRHAAHGLHLDLAGLVGLVDVLQFDDGLHAVFALSPARAAKAAATAAKGTGLSAGR